MWPFPRQKDIRRKHILGCGSLVERLESQQSSDTNSSPLNRRDATDLPSTSSGGVFMPYRLRHSSIQRTTGLLPTDGYRVSSSSSSTGHQGPCPQNIPTAQRQEPTTTATMWGASIREPASIHHLQGKGILGSHPRNTQQETGILGSHPGDTQNCSRLSFHYHHDPKCCFSLLTSAGDAGEALTAELRSTQKVINSDTMKEEGHHRKLAIGKSVSPMPDYPPTCLASALPVPSSSSNTVMLPSKPSLYNRAGRAYQRNGRYFQTRGWNGIQTDWKRHWMDKDGATSKSSFENVFI